MFELNSHEKSDVSCISSLQYKCDQVRRQVLCYLCYLYGRQVRMPSRQTHGTEHGLRNTSEPRRAGGRQALRKESSVESVLETTGGQLDTTGVLGSSVRRGCEEDASVATDELGFVTPKSTDLETETDALKGTVKKKKPKKATVAVRTCGNPRPRHGHSYRLEHGGQVTGTFTGELNTFWQCLVETTAFFGLTNIPEDAPESFSQLTVPYRPPLPKYCASSHQHACHCGRNGRVLDSEPRGTRPEPLNGLNGPWCPVKDFARLGFRRVKR
ncbi:hypothetical protein Bbelb_385140 [Branchiostoma belcheri]|nr:hypothetical protein Bbelb_385140 [Branchiostoma belcheri]